MKIDFFEITLGGFLCVSGSFLIYAMLVVIPHSMDLNERKVIALETAVETGLIINLDAQLGIINDDD